MELSLTVDQRVNEVGLAGVRDCVPECAPMTAFSVVEGVVDAIKFCLLSVLRFGRWVWDRARLR